MTQSTTFEKQQSRITCTADEVSQYLLKYTNFFDKHPEVLAQLDLSHSSGAAISLIERQVGVLRKENKTLRNQIKSLVNVAKQNDDLMQKIHSLSMSLLKAVSIEEFLEIIHSQLETDFDADFVAVRLLNNEISQAAPADILLDPSDEVYPLFDSILNRGKPICGRLNRQQLQYLFADDAEEVVSVAVVPLFYSTPKGLLAIGSRDAERFRAGTSTTFLNQLGDMAGLSLNRFA
ncbi:MAG: DUF484 family protein [Gammaproteobacteria bacterium]|nr:DUF484 family protein [Gammaproteobacteria bacterium]MDH5728767.1 DUF484 family protein [Gammaproteobacteria bacterium]